jgi:hypothetical protein
MNRILRLSMFLPIAFSLAAVRLVAAEPDYAQVLNAIMPLKETTGPIPGQGKTLYEVTIRFTSDWGEPEKTLHLVKTANGKTLAWLRIADNVSIFQQYEGNKERVKTIDDTLGKFFVSSFEIDGDRCVGLGEVLETIETIKTAGIEGSSYEFVLDGGTQEIFIEPAGNNSVTYEFSDQDHPLVQWAFRLLAIGERCACEQQ